MTGGRAYLYDLSGRHVAALDVRSVAAVRLGVVLAERPDGPARLTELLRLLEGQRAAGSTLADGLLQEADIAAAFWLVEPIAQPPAVVGPDIAATQPDRNIAVPVSMPTPEVGVPTMDRTWGRVTPG
jgi:hypothetical protein